MAEIEKIIGELVDAWMANNRANLLLLQEVTPEGMEAVSRPRARTVGEQFAHIHNARLMWLDTAAPQLIGEMQKIGKGEVQGKEALRSALEKSAEAIAALIKEGFRKGKINGFKPSPSGFFAYLIAHEGHHRGQILLTLKLAGQQINQKTQYGIWDWGKL